MVGYELDGAHYEGQEGTDGSQGRTKVAYLLPGGLMSTDAMASGQKAGEAEVEVGGAGIAVWE